MAISRPKIMKYYIQGSTLSFEEDMTHEFKGHRNLCEEELPEWAKKTKVERASRKPVSRFDFIFKFMFTFTVALYT